MWYNYLRQITLFLRNFRQYLITERRTDMKVIGFNGSPRKDGNTTTLISYLLREIEKEGIETQLVQLSAKAIHGCIACYKCFENQDQRCAVKNDAANEYIEKMTMAQVSFWDLLPIFRM